MTEVNVHQITLSIGDRQVFTVGGFYSESAIVTQIVQHADRSCMVYNDAGGSTYLAPYYVDHSKTIKKS